MDTKYRFRYLIYFAALMLVMSVCFVYAEPMPSAHPLLFQTAPQHAGFLAACHDEPVFDPSALRTATAPLVSPAMLLELQGAAHTHRGLLHRSRRTVLETRPVNIQVESSIQGLSMSTPSGTSLR